MIKQRDCESSYLASDLQGINSELNLKLTNSSPSATSRTSLEGPTITTGLTRDIRGPHSEVWRTMNWGSPGRFPRRWKSGCVAPPVQTHGRMTAGAAGRINFIGEAAYRFALQKSGNEAAIKPAH